MKNLRQKKRKSQKKFKLSKLWQTSSYAAYEDYIVVNLSTKPTMASVYKTLSAKSNGQSADEEMRDLDLEEMLENNDETSDSDEDEDEDEEDKKPTRAEPKSQSPYMPKTRVLMLTSRGISYRYAHLFSNIAAHFKRRDYPSQTAIDTNL